MKKISVSVLAVLASLSVYAQPVMAAGADLLKEVETIQFIISQPQFNRASAALYLDKFYNEALSADPRAFDREKAIKDAPQIIERLFESRMALHDKLVAFENQGGVSPETVKSIRNFNRAARYMEHLVGETAFGGKLKKKEIAAPLFSEGRSNLLINSRYSGINLKDGSGFKNGDVIMVRGNRFNSAAIARIGDVDSQFSHAAIIYKPNPAEIDLNKIYVVEALIEVGTVTHTLQEVLNEGMGHAVLLRYPEADCAGRAAARMFGRAKNERIDYAFDMEIGKEHLGPNGYKLLFCSLVIKEGFDRECGTNLPSFRTTFSQKNRDFMDSIGVTARETIAPGDLEIDTHFDIVAEWRDYRVTPDIRHKDLILTKIFDWMEKSCYSFDPTLLVSSGAELVYQARHTSFMDIGDKVQEYLQIPPGMRKTGLESIVMLQLSASPMLKAVEKAENENLSKYGVPLHPRQILEVLDKFRADGKLKRTYLQEGRASSCSPNSSTRSSFSVLGLEIPVTYDYPSHSR